MANVTDARTANLDEIVDVPLHPPVEWFSLPPGLAPGTGLTITDEGRVYGYWYDAGQCLVHSPSECPRPSPTQCAAANQNTVQARGVDGELVTLRVGVIGQAGGHAHERASVASAAAHYSNPDRQRIVARIAENEHGGWFAGALVPGLTRREVEQARRSATSGDWRKFPQAWWDAHGVTAAQVHDAEGYDTLGPTLVTRPALPLVPSTLPLAAAVGEGDGEARYSEPIPPADDGAAYDATHNEERTAAVANEANATAELTLDTEKVEALLLGHAEKIEAMVAGVSERLDALEARNTADDDQRAAEAKARAAAVTRPDLPAPDGFDERTWIEYTTADLEWLEMTGRTAAAVPPQFQRGGGGGNGPPPRGGGGMAAQLADHERRIAALERAAKADTASEGGGNGKTAAAQPAPSPLSAGDRGAGQRKKDAASGVAMADGSFPIRNAGDLANAKRAIGRAAPGRRDAVIAHINRRARALGLPGVGQSKAA